MKILYIISSCQRKINLRKKYLLIVAILILFQSVNLTIHSFNNNSCTHFHSKSFVKVRRRLVDTKEQPKNFNKNCSRKGFK